MGKSSSNLNMIYLAGMVLIAIGFILPMFKGLGISANGFDFISLNNFNATTIAAILIFGGALIGIAFCFVGSSNGDMIKLAAIIISIAGGILILLTYNKNGISRMVGRGFWKKASYGTYMILVGWILSVVGWFKK